MDIYLSFTKYTENFNPPLPLSQLRRALLLSLKDLGYKRANTNKVWSQKIPIVKDPTNNITSIRILKTTHPQEYEVIEQVLHSNIDKRINYSLYREFNKIYINILNSTENTTIVKIKPLIDIEIKTITDNDVVAKYNSIKCSAAKRDIAFNMSLRKIRYLLNLKKCQITGVEFTNKSGLHDNSRSVDRLKNNEGYTDSNTIAVTHKFNQQKNNMELEDMIKCIQIAKRRKLI